MYVRAGVLDGIEGWLQERCKREYFCESVLDC
jgi:hypothetical protein